MSWNGGGLRTRVCCSRSCRVAGLPRDRRRTRSGACVTSGGVDAYVRRPSLSWRQGTCVKLREPSKAVLRSRRGGRGPCALAVLASRGLCARGGGPTACRRIVNINALRALAPLPRAPVPRPSRPQPRTPPPAGAAGTASSRRRPGRTPARPPHGGCVASPGSSPPLSKIFHTVLTWGYGARSNREKSERGFSGPFHLISTAESLYHHPIG